MQSVPEACRSVQMPQTGVIEVMSNAVVAKNGKKKQQTHTRKQNIHTYVCQHIYIYMFVSFEQKQQITTTTESQQQSQQSSICHLRSTRNRSASRWSDALAPIFASASWACPMWASRRSSMCWPRAPRRPRISPSAPLSPMRISIPITIGCRWPPGHQFARPVLIIVIMRSIWTFCCSLLACCQLPAPEPLLTWLCRRKGVSPSEARQFCRI